MRKFTKLLSMLLVLILALATTVGCKTPGENPDDSNSGPTSVPKTQISVEVVDVGYGTLYLENLATRFEKAFEEKSYKDGEKGVDVIITPYKGYLDESKFTSNDYDVFFGTGSNALQSWMSRGSLLNLNDIATQTLTAYGETRSIKDKFYEGAENLYCYNGEVYAIPGLMSPYGIQYNVDVWEEYKLYFNKNNEFISSKADVESGNLGTGPDGYPGTYDDGLPRTYEEFFKVMDKMKKHVQPIVWDGKDYVYYLEDMVESLHMNAETIDQYMLNLTFNGNATSLVKEIKDDGTVVLEDSTPISNDNGYELFSQAGVYYATYFMDKLLSDDEYWNGDNVFSESYTNLDAQLDFLKTHAVSAAAEIGMLIEGGYWEQESFENGNFGRVAKYGEQYKRENRRLAYMPMPMPTLEMVESHKGHNLVTQGYTVVAASAKVANYKVPAVKDFIQYCFTDESLVDTTKTTSLFYALDYKFDSDDYAKLSHYGKSVADYLQAETTHIKMATSTNKMYMENMQSFDSHRRYQSQPIGTSSTLGSMFDVLRKDQITAKNYFLGIENRVSGTFWTTNYSKYLTKN